MAKKEEKKQKKNKKDINQKKHTKTKGQEVMRSLDKENNISAKKALTVLLIVVAIVAIVYLVAALIMGDISLKSDEPTATIQYENILAGSTFKQHDKEYIVVYYDFEDTDASKINTAISNYDSTDSAKALYKVDLSLKQNQVYTTEETSNKKPTKATELKINGPTLIYIKDGKVNTYIEGVDQIEDYLK